MSDKSDGPPDLLIYNYWCGNTDIVTLRAYCVVTTKLLEGETTWDLREELLSDSFHELLTICVSRFTEEQLMNAITKYRLGVELEE
jgi:hypothetical protein